SDCGESLMNDIDCIAGPLSDPPRRLEELLKVEQVAKEFPMNDGSNFTVLRGLSFTIHNLDHKPQIVSLLGPSGAGKTTILRLIAGLDGPTGGQIWITGGAGRQLRPVAVGDVGVVFQRYPLFEDLNVVDNLMVPAIRSGKAAAAAKSQALAYLDEF